MTATAIELEAPATPARLPLPTRVFGRSFYYGWYIVALAFVAGMMSAGIQAYGLGVFVTPMTEELGWSRTDISLGQTLSTAVMGVVGFAMGGLLDRRGGRLMMVIGAVIAGTGFMLLGQVHELWQYYAVKAGVLTFGMAGMGAMVTNVAVSNWFIRRRGRAIAVAAMGNSFAAMFIPSLAAWMIDSFGWRTAWAVLGAAVWVIVIPIAALVMRRRPEDHGLEPDGGRVVPRANDRLSQQRARVDAVRWTRAQAMRTPTLWLLILVFGLGSMGFGAMLLHLIPFLTDSGYSRVEAAGAFSMIGVSGFISKPIWGVIADKLPTKFAAVAEFILLGAGVAFILAAPSLALMYVAIFVLGMGVGGVITIQETVWADYFGRLTLGTVRSVGRPFTIVSSAGGPVLAGVAYDVGGSYQVAFLAFIGAYVLAACLILITPTPRHPGDSPVDATPPTELPRTPAYAAAALVPAGDNGRAYSNGSTPNGASTAPLPRKAIRPRRRDYMGGAPRSGKDYMHAESAQNGTTELPRP